MIVIALLAALWSGQETAPAPPEAAPPNLVCEAGPAKRTYGGTAWLVYGCQDGVSLVFVTDTGSAAFPFMFLLYRNNGAYALSGEGTGDRRATSAAYEDLKALQPVDIAQLLSETAATSPPP